MIRASFTSIMAIVLTSLPVMASEGAKDWNYGDGITDERWSLVNTDYALCDAGLNQSPIDLGAANSTGNIAFSANYGTATGQIASGHGKIQMDFTSGQDWGMESGDLDFNLLQVHFHTPSEHAIDGKHFPLTAHLVHATADGQLGVLGIMFTPGEENAALSQIFNAYEKKPDSTINVNLAAMIPDNPGVYRYMGSLTTPPCSEGVHWHVASTPIEASPEQIAIFEEVLGPSARSLQPHGNRLIVAPTTRALAE